MYASLGKVDLGVSFEGEAGETVHAFVQTDHRSALEISNDGAFSALFAIARCLAARALAIESGRRPFRVLYQLAAEPPAVLAYVVGAAGATLVREVDRAAALSAPALEPRLTELAAVVADACRQIAAAAWERERLEPTLEGLDAYLHRRWPWDRDDEIAVARGLIEVASLSASLITPALASARFVHADGIVPFVLAGSRGGEELLRVDVFGRAQRFLDEGHDESPLALVSAVTGARLDRPSAFAAYEALSGAALDAATLEARALAGAPDDHASRERAERLARSVADALRAWGEPVGDEVRWVTRSVRATDLRPIGKRVRDLVDSAHRGFDGHLGVRPAEALIQALERASERHGGFDGRREDWYTAWDFRSVAALGLRVPESAPRFAGEPFSRLPDPFAPLLATWATGYVIESIDERGVTLVCVGSERSAT